MGRHLLRRLTPLRLGLVAILATGAALRLWRLERNEFGTEYYSAGVRSMSQSWHAFLYNAFDPAGFVSLDKPPVAFWIQTLGARLFGFHEMSVLLPQVVEGLLSILLLHHLVARRFGPAPALLAALFLALTPLAVAVDRSSNTESSLVLCLLLAAWAARVATERGSLALLAVTALLMGIAFNIKMLVGLALLPTLGLLYLLFAPLSWPRRVLHLGIAGAIVVPVALSWAVMFDLTPPDRRPYAGSSQHNSMLELVVQHNALERFVLPPRAERRPPPPADAPAQPAPRLALYDAIPVGPLRLADPHLARQILWLMPLAVFGLLALAADRLMSRSRAAATPAQPSPAAPIVGSTASPAGTPAWPARSNAFPATAADASPESAADSDRRSPDRDAPPLAIAAPDLLLWLGWFATYAAAYSAAGGIFHAYYLVTLAPPLAALAGIGSVALWIASGMAGKGRWLLPAALLLTASWQIGIAGDALGLPAGRLLADPALALRTVADAAAWQSALLAVLVASTLLAAGLLMRPPSRSWRIAATVVGVAGALLLPAAWAVGCGIVPGNIMLPAARLADLARPEEPVSPTMRRLRSGRVPLEPGLADFLRDNRDGAKFLVAVPNARIAAPLIIRTGEPVMALGGFSGTDPILTPDQLAARVAAGEVRYLLLGPAGSFGFAGAGIDRRRQWLDWARANGRFVNPTRWSAQDRGYRALLLFDLRSPAATPQGQ